MSRRALSVALIGALSLTALAAPAEATPARVRFLGEQIVPNGLAFEGTTVGGLSSIDYDPRTGQYAFISDDRSALQPARFYTAKFDVTAKGLGPVTFTGTHPFLRPDGATYPPLAQNDPALPQNEQTVDPEELRVDPWTGDYYWTQEGERTATTLIDPSLREAKRDGEYVRDLPIPANERMLPDAGPRQNLVLEGLTFAAAGSLVVSALEGPLLQDGPLATTDQGQTSRITVQSRFGPVLAQFAYPQEPIFAAGAGGSTGVSSILAVDATHYYVLERSFVSGVGDKIRIYEADLSGATNVLGQSLAGARPVRKKLVADLSDYPLSTVDNIEGITWGPRLPTGERSLILVSDNNFSSRQVTQVLAFAVGS